MGRKLILIAIAGIFSGLLPHALMAGEISNSLLGPGKWNTPGDSVDVWVFFTDRGFSSPQEFQDALRKAEEALLPTARARRQKVKRGALVDEHDLPVNYTYARRVLDLGVRYRTTSRYLNAISVRSPLNLLTKIAALSFVARICPVAKGHRIEPEPNWGIVSPLPRQPEGVDQLNYGPSYAQLNQINVVAAHDSGYSGAGVLVCLLDTGFFKDHEALINQPIVAEWDFINNDPETQNEPGDDSTQHDHGTYTFSALGGAHDGDLYGPAYGASFLLAKTESIEFEQAIEEDWYVAGLEWADSLGAQVVSSSLGYLDWYTFADLDGNTAVTTIGVDMAVANGMVVVTAAGNERETSWGHIIAPADADSVIAVGAVDSTGEITFFSSPGPTYDGRIKPEVCARGWDTWCAVPWGGATNLYWGIGGTSLSTPLVAGSCALLLEAHPNWTPMQVRAALMATASNADNPDNDYGWGIIDVMAAMNVDFAPYIVQRHPEAGMQVIYPDTLLDFWVSASDPEGDSLLFRWWVDSTQIYFGPDSSFSYFWTNAGSSSVKVIVEDPQQNQDSTLWTILIEESSGINTTGESATPSDFVLYPGFPNPFNPTTTISFDIPSATPVKLAIYDVNGSIVKVLVDEELHTGHYQRIFAASEFPSGVYFARLTAGAHRQTQKLLLIK